MTGRPAVLGDVTAVRIDTHSDWHVGAGAGVPGALHAAVLRDSDGLPYVPGTTLTGVLRDACLTVAVALDEGRAYGAWQRWHRFLFGDAGDREGPRAGRRLAPAAVAVSAARLPAPLRREIRGDSALVDTAAITTVGVSIDEDTGRAKDDHLRFVELARSGLPLVATLRLSPPPDDDSRTAVTALLVLGAAWCETLGGQRRRGAGQVSIRLGDQRAEQWARWLADCGWQPPDALPAVAGPGRPADLAAVAPHGGSRWQRIDVTVTLDAPVRIQRQVVGNSALGYDHVPGGMLLAWLSQRLEAHVVREAVAAETLLIRHGYPEVDGARGVPVPLALHRDKHGSDLTVGAAQGDFRQVRDRWTVLTAPGGRVVLQRPGLQWRSHNSVDRGTQRPKGDAGVYAVEVIPAGRRLRAELLVGEELTRTLAARYGHAWWEPLAGRARLGTRRRGEYGAVRVAVSAPEPVSSPPAAGSEFTLLAVSDLLVRGPGLRYTADPEHLADDVSRRLGTPIEVDPVAVRAARREGWQAAWQLPRESLAGIAAGSVVRVRLSGEVAPHRWQRFVTEGVGDRRVEGFGEIAVDPPLLRQARVAVDRDPPETPGSDVGELDDEQRQVLQRLRDVAARRRLTAAVTHLRGDRQYDALRAALGRLSASQRGIWLAVAVDAALRADPDRLVRAADAWLGTGLDRRRDQRAAAEQVKQIRGWLPERLASQGVDLDTASLQGAAVVALLSDVLDELRRAPGAAG